MWYTPNKITTAGFAQSMILGAKVGFEEPRSSSQRFSSRCPYSVQVAMVPFSIIPSLRSHDWIYVVELYCIYYWWRGTWASQKLTIFRFWRHTLTWRMIGGARGTWDQLISSDDDQMMVVWWSVASQHWKNKILKNIFICQNPFWPVCFPFMTGFGIPKHPEIRRPGHNLTRHVRGKLLDRYRFPGIE